jgi:DNA replication protein
MKPFDKTPSGGVQDKPFDGFPARMDFTSVPNIVFSQLLAEINDIAELKALLSVIRAIYGKRGYPRFATYGELADNPALLTSLGGSEALHHALEQGEKRGTLLHVAMEQAGKTEDIYFLNTEKDREVAEKLKNGQLSLPGLNVKPHSSLEIPAAMPNIFSLYEDNIGLLTPMIAEELREAEKTYPEAWLRDAIKRAVDENKRKWSYIQGILERWAREGKDDGTYPRNTRKTDPDKYIKGKYGHMVQR